MHTHNIGFRNIEIEEVKRWCGVWALLSFPSLSLSYFLSSIPITLSLSTHTFIFHFPLFFFFFFFFFTIHVSIFPNSNHTSNSRIYDSTPRSDPRCVSRGSSKSNIEHGNELSASFCDLRRFQ